VDFDGPLIGLLGACPSVTFHAGARTVQTDAGTDFHKSSCDALAVGVHVHGKGRVQASGIVVADNVEIKGGD
jgi:hypothetical protein